MFCAMPTVQYFTWGSQTRKPQSPVAATRPRALGSAASHVKQRRLKRQMLYAANHPGLADKESAVARYGDEAPRIGQRRQPGDLAACRGGAAADRRRLLVHAPLRV